MIVRRDVGAKGEDIQDVADFLWILEIRKVVHEHNKDVEDSHDVAINLRLSSN